VSITPRRVALAVPLLLVGAALNGCGVTDEEIRPGIAADVDGTVIRQSDLDDTVSGTCDYLDQAEGVSRFPRATVRRQLLQTLVRQVAAEHLVDELDVDLPDEYAPAIASIDKTYADAPGDQATAMREGDKASTYVAVASDAVGAALLRKETGTEPQDANQIRARGTQEVAAWLGDHDVELNPTYGLRLDDGSFVADDGLSVPESSEAVFARGVSDIDLGDADQDVATLIADATAKLPEDQVCGPAA
jgi:hypothetical protein